MIPVVDIFAGPGGLGEGFSSLRGSTRGIPFHVGVSIERTATPGKRFVFVLSFASSRIGRRLRSTTRICGERYRVLSCTIPFRKSRRERISLR